MASSSPSSLSFDEQDCPVAAAKTIHDQCDPAVYRVLGFCACHFFLIYSFHTFWLSVAVSASAQTLSSSVDECISERIHMPEDEEGLYCMSDNGGNNISSN